MKANVEDQLVLGHGFSIPEPGDRRLLWQRELKTLENLGIWNQRRVWLMGKKKRNKSGQAGGSVAVADEIKQVPGSRPQGFSVTTESKPAFYSSRYFEWLALALASLVSYWILTSRLVGVNVSVLIDEYSYVLDSHYRGLSEAYYPNHLFQLVYSVTKECGPEFYSCARSINAAFVVASGVVIYYLAKYLSSKKWMGAVVFAAAVFGSFGTYTAYFMPEAIFNFFMILFFYSLARFGQSDRIGVWISLGMILGIASLAKPHALFVVPALLIYIFLLTRATKGSYLLDASKRLLVFLGSLVASKLGFGFLIAGPKALSLFGSYGGVTIDSNFVSSSADLVEGTLLAESTLANVFVTSWGQTLMMVMILGVSMAVAITSLLSSWTKDSGYFLANRFRNLFAISLLNMMAVAALFEAWQSLTNWMHTRYSSYLIPLALVVLVEASVQSNMGTKKLTKQIVVGIFTVLSTIALATAAMPYGANWIDAPDFKAHIDNPILSSFAIVVAIALGIWWLWNEKTPMLAALVFALVASLGAGTYISSFLQVSFGQDSTHDDLGRVLRNNLPQDELDRTLLVGDNNTAMERALFSALTGQARYVLAPESGFDLAGVGPEDRWLVKVGDPLISGLGNPTVSGPGYALYSLSDLNSLTPRSNGAASFSNTCSESGSSEWACGAETVVSLNQPLSPSAEIDLIVEVSESAANGDIEFVLGNSMLTGALPSGIYSLKLAFANSAVADELIIRQTAGSLKEEGSAEKFVRVVSVNGKAS